MNKCHFNEQKQDAWKCDWLIGHIISITLENFKTCWRSTRSIYRQPSASRPGRCPQRPPALPPWHSLGTKTFLFQRGCTRWRYRPRRELMPMPHEVRLLELTRSLSPLLPGGGRMLSQGMGGRRHMLTGDPTHLYGPPYLVRPWMGRWDIASLHQRHRALRQSYTGVEGGFIQQDIGVARPSCSCGTPPPSGRWSPFWVCVGIWTHGSHSLEGTMGGSNIVVWVIPESLCTHRRRLQWDVGDCGLAERHGWQGPRIGAIQRGACPAQPRRDGVIRLVVHMAHAHVSVPDRPFPLLTWAPRHTRLGKGYIFA